MSDEPIKAAKDGDGDGNSNISGIAGNPSIEPSAEEQLIACRKEREEYLAGWQRAKADFLNFKKDEAARINELIKLGLEDVIEDLLTVLDSFDLAIQAQKQDGKSDKGVYLIKTQLFDILRKRGLEAILPDPDGVFDPATSEAVGSIESDFAAGNIAEVISAGYRIHGKVLRPARVMLSKGRDTADDQPSASLTS